MSDTTTVVAFVPLKINSQRVPRKIFQKIGGKTLLQRVMELLMEVPQFDRVVAYCSSPEIASFLPAGVDLVLRDTRLDGDEVKGEEIYDAFIKDVYADVYALVHATAPFLSSKSLESGLEAVLAGDFDSSFSVERKQTFGWFDGSPLNYRLADIPRTQDLDPIFLETSGFYIFERSVWVVGEKRVGENPKMIEMGWIESIDIDTWDDLEIANCIIDRGLAN